MQNQGETDLSRRDLLSLIGSVAGSAAMYHAMTSLGFASESTYKGPIKSAGGAMIVHTIGNEIVNIEGDKRSPHNEGCLCPKGAATYQLIKNPNRATRVLHRKPGATDWEPVELDWAMDRIAQLVKKTRDETFIERMEDGTLINQTTGIFSLGGATLDNEWNHLQQKLMRGLGAVAIENQARI
jgi:formate dehydrogenase major subunit